MHDDGFAVGGVLLDAGSSASRTTLDVAGLDRGDSGEVFEDHHAWSLRKKEVNSGKRWRG